MKRQLTLLVLLISLFGLMGCGSSNDNINQVSGQQGNTGGGNNVPVQTGTVTGRIVSATTGDPVAGATVTAPANGVNAQGGFSATTDANGNFILVCPVGTYDLIISAPGFVDYLQRVTVLLSQTTEIQQVVIAPGLGANERYRFVLTWGETPADLDSHLWLPAETPYEVYYRQKGNATEFPFATLDVDDTTSYGPETTTINELVGGGDYEYGINNYNNTGTVAGATVRIYDRTGLIHTVTPTNTNGEYWVVANVDGETGELTIVNETLADIRSPYVNNQGASDISQRVK